jgi:hypothetical protein
MRTRHARRYGDVRLGTDQLGGTLAESPVSAKAGRMGYGRESWT